MKPYKINSNNYIHRKKKRNFSVSSNTNKKPSLTKGIILFWILPVALSAFLLYNSTDFFYKGPQKNNNNGSLKLQEALYEGKSNNSITSNNLRNSNVVEPTNSPANTQTFAPNGNSANISENNINNNKLFSDSTSSNSNVKFEVKETFPEQQLFQQNKLNNNDSEKKNIITEKSNDMIDQTVYFVRLNGSKPQLYPVKRKVNKNNSIKGLISELMNGPNNKEREIGLKQFIPRETKLLGYKIKDKIIYLNFNESFTFTNSKTAKLKIAQLVATLTNRGEIEGVGFLINNNKVEYLDNEGILSNKIMTKINTLKKYPAKEKIEND